MNLMKALVLEKKGKIQLKTVPKPQPRKGEALIRVKACGICGSDLPRIYGDIAYYYPSIPGHEFAGEVQEVGDSEKDRFWIGKRVTVFPLIPCYQCRFCQAGLYEMCEEYGYIGSRQDGAFAEYVAVPEKCVFALPDHISYSEAALAEPLACVVYGIRRSGIKPGEKALVFGAGAIGLLLMSLLKISGASQVVMVDISTKKLDFAKSLGASEVVLNDDHLEKNLKSIAPFGFDVVADATGNPRVMEKQIRFVQPDGTFLVFGVAPRGEMMSVEPYDIFLRDIHVVGSYAVKKTMQYSINLISSGKIQVKNLISASYPLDEFEKGIHDFYHDPDHMKIQIIP